MYKIYIDKVNANKTHVQTLANAIKSTSKNIVLKKENNSRIEFFFQKQFHAVEALKNSMLKIRANDSGAYLHFSETGSALKADEACAIIRRVS